MVHVSKDSRNIPLLRMNNRLKTASRESRVLVSTTFKDVLSKQEIQTIICLVYWANSLCIRCKQKWGDWIDTSGALLGIWLPRTPLIHVTSVSKPPIVFLYQFWILCIDYACAYLSAFMPYGHSFSFSNFVSFHKYVPKPKLWLWHGPIKVSAITSSTNLSETLCIDC